MMQPLDPFKVPLSGINLIEASAGTGKTYNIASLYVRALIERDISVEEILVVTYTKAATAELRDRLMKRLRDSVQSLKGEMVGQDAFLEQLRSVIDQPNQAIQKLNKAIHTFDQAAIYTIHGFCYQALQEYAFESRALFDVELTEDDTEIIRNLVDDYWRKWVSQATDSPLKQPLLRFLVDKGYNPDSLTDELIDYLGKPYLTIQPDEVVRPDTDEQLYQLTEQYEALREEWETSRNQIFKLMTESGLGYYTVKSVQKWMMQMDLLLQNEVASIELFDKFIKFTQSTIDDSLTKKAQKKGQQPPRHPFFELADAYQTTAAFFQAYDVTFKFDLFTFLSETEGRKKEELQQLSYDDVLVKLRDALASGGTRQAFSKILRERYPIALVDEFQDTDPIQYQIFQAIYQDEDHDAALFMIGDPKQSIYGFRGADIFAYLQARQALPGDRLYSLGHNYRSTPDLVEGINTLFRYRPRPFVYEAISFLTVKAGIEDDRPLVIGGETTMPLVIRDLSRHEDELPLSKGQASKKSAQDTASDTRLLTAMDGEPSERLTRIRDP